MRIRHLSVRNFRGIEQLDWAVPDTGLLCLIGRGDSTKSSVLDAIRFALFPAWNLSVDTFDFFQGDTRRTIRIVATIGALPETFKSDAKYGNWLRGWDKQAETLQDEPGDGLEEVLSVALTIESSLEPKWSVVRDDREEDKTFSLSDRVDTRTTFIGAYADRHLTWGKNTALSRLTEAESIAESLATAASAAKDALDSKRATDLTGFDEAATIAEGIAKRYGVPVSEEGSYRAHLDTTAVNIQAGGLSLHDGNIPVRTLGLGSRRMLTLGIEQHALNEPHITLIDEVEIGLEPHRITRLLRNIESDDCGQYFLTTHSPAVLRELTVDQLFVAQSIDHTTKVVPAAQPGFTDTIQGKIRAGAEAFLAANVIVCEGATEVGLCRGLETYWIGQGIDSFSYSGTALFDAHSGSQIKSSAEAFRRLGYHVAAIGDSDSEENFSQSDAQTLEELGVHVIRWDGGLTTEEYFFRHLPWDKVLASVELAKRLRGDGVIDQVKSHIDDIDDNIASWTDSLELRAAIGKAALGGGQRRNAWFKRLSRAQTWANEISDAFNIPGSVIAEKITALKTWVCGG